MLSSCYKKCLLYSDKMEQKMNDKYIASIHYESFATVSYIIYDKHISFTYIFFSFLTNIIVCSLFVSYKLAQGIQCWLSYCENKFHFREATKKYS